MTNNDNYFPFCMTNGNQKVVCQLVSKNITNCVKNTAIA